MGWLGDLFTGTPRYQGVNSWQWARALDEGTLSDEQIRAAFCAMGPMAFPALIELLNNEKQPCHSRVRDVLAAMGAAVVKQVVEAYLHAPDSSTRFQCCLVLQQLGHKAAAALTEALTRYPDPKADVLELLVGRLLEPLLQPGVGSAAFYQATSELTQMGMDVVPSLAALITSGDMGIKVVPSLAARIMAGHKEPRLIYFVAIEALASFYKLDQGHVETVIAKRLRGLKGLAGFEFLFFVEQLTHRDATVRCVAEFFLTLCALPSNPWYQDVRAQTIKWAIYIKTQKNQTDPEVRKAGETVLNLIEPNWRRQACGGEKGTS
jgi:hypothetical protein